MIIKIISIICIRIISITIITTSIGTSEEDVERLVAAMDVDGDGKVTYQEYLNSFRLLILQTILLMVKLMLTKVNGGRAKGLYFYYFLQFLDGCLSPRVTFLINSRFCNFAACTAVTICAVLFLQFFIATEGIRHLSPPIEGICICNTDSVSANGIRIHQI